MAILSSYNNLVFCAFSVSDNWAAEKKVQLSHSFMLIILILALNWI